MKLYRRSSKDIFVFAIGATLLLSTILTIIIYYIFPSKYIIFLGIAITFISIIIEIIFLNVFSKKLDDFTLNLMRTMDKMINGEKISINNLEEENSLSKINNKLEKLYDIMENQKNIVDMERNNLQLLISDISHQTKLPISNLKMINETLIMRELSYEEQIEFLKSSENQLDKLEFLIKAMIKTSRLENGIIKLHKVESRINETIINAVNEILPIIEKNNMELSIKCDENLKLNHDYKWTSEAIFNILDNAVKYSKDSRRININVEEWEIYIKIDIEDFGIGISEGEQATIFKRFYRSKDVYNIDGIGIGLYLSREIISMEGGYIKVHSEIGKGSIFSIYLPKNL